VLCSTTFECCWRCHAQSKMHSNCCRLSAFAPVVGGVIPSLNAYQLLQTTRYLHLPLLLAVLCPVLLHSNCCRLSAIALTVVPHEVVQVHVAGWQPAVLEADQPWLVTQCAAIVPAQGSAVTEVHKVRIRYQMRCYCRATRLGSWRGTLLMHLRLLHRATLPAAAGCGGA
jgi:hypothetical protein